MTIRSKQKIVTHIPMNIVLIEPEIPPNTGNIARLCAATNTSLHLVHPLGFKLTDKDLKRAGLDYWPLLNVKEHSSWNDFKSSESERKSNFWFLSTRGEKNIWDVDFNPGDYLIFGSESKGLSESILNENTNNIISIPMNGMVRSINLATAVGIVLYETLRQISCEKKLYNITPI